MEVIYRVLICYCVVRYVCCNNHSEGSGRKETNATTLQSYSYRSISTLTVSSHDPNTTDKHKKRLSDTENKRIEHTIGTTEMFGTDITKISTEDTSNDILTKLTASVISTTSNQVDPCYDKGTCLMESTKKLDVSEISTEDTNNDLFTTISVSSTTTIQIDPCYDKGTCLFESTQKHRYCNCDDECIEYKDCCIDKTFRHNISNNANAFSTYHDYWECYKPNNVHTYYGGFFVVGACPTRFENETIASRCHSNDLISNGPPVLHNKSTVFKNQYCALCHGVVEFETFEIEFRLISFNILLELGFFNKSISEKLSILIENEHLEYVLLTPKDVILRPCMSSLIVGSSDQCKEASINPVYVVKRRQPSVYKNKYCAPQTNENVLTCVGSLYSKIGDMSRFFFYPMSIMFSFKQKPDRENKDNCAIWSPKAKESSVCPNLEVFTNASVSLFPFHLKSTVALGIEDLQLIGIAMAWSLQTVNLSLVLRTKMYVVENSTEMYLKVNEVIIIKSMFGEEVSRIINQLESIKWKAFFIDEINLLTANIEKHGNNHTSDWQNLDKKFIISEYFHEKDYFQKKNIRLLENLQHVFCNEITLNITRKITGDVHVKFVSCENYEERNPLVSHDNGKVSTETILTYAGFSVSTVALLCLIVINRKMGITKRISGSNLENVSVSLSISNVAFMTGIGSTQFRWMCYGISVFLHYCWLCTFSFMCISVVFIVRNLPKLRSMVGKSGISFRKRFLVIVVGLLIPLVFVIPAVVVDNIGPEIISPGYGQMVCFPNSFPGNLIFFSGPLIMSLLLSLFGLLGFMINMYRYTQNIQHLSNSNTSMAKVFIRILVLSNLVWIFGIASSWTEILWIKCVFTSICGLHGFLITIASLTTRHFRNLLAQRSLSSE